MRVSTTSIAVCVLVGGAFFAPETEAATARRGQQATTAHAAPSHAVTRHKAYRHHGGRVASRHRSGGTEAATPDAQAILAFGTSVAPLARDVGLPRNRGLNLSLGPTVLAFNGSPFAYNAYATGGWAGESRFGGRPRGGLQCVPFARDLSGIEIRGNARTWWYAANGRYDRGNRPEPGSVLSFRASGGMRNGHVAVVSRVMGPRHVQIDHANWEGPGLRKGSIMHNANVIDVSPLNDWTAVRVQVGYDEASFGRTYPTYGFIYNRPDTGTMMAQAPRLRMPVQEVAEMPGGGRR